MDSIFNAQNAEFILRWIHIISGVTWIGLLYYFNFVQGEYFKEADGAAKSDAIQKLVPRALWWFRWGAMFTFLTGVALLGIIKPNTGFGIIVGGTLGTIMFLNVWMIIWPNQKIVIASAQQVAGGGEPLPNAAAALGKAGLASRTNTLFSIPMLFFMGSSRHWGYVNDSITDASTVSLFAVFGLILLLALNGIKGKTGPFTSVKGVITMGLVLTAVLFAMIEFLQVSQT